MLHPVFSQPISLVSMMWRVIARTYWLVSAWNYRRQAKAQNRHAKAVNRRIAELTDLARDADARARLAVGLKAQSQESMPVGPRAQSKPGKALGAPTSPKPSKDSRHV